MPFDASEKAGQGVVEVSLGPPLAAVDLEQSLGRPREHRCGQPAEPPPAGLFRCRVRAPRLTAASFPPAGGWCARHRPGRARFRKSRQGRKSGETLRDPRCLPRGRVRSPLPAAHEQARQLDVGRPAELADRAQLGEAVAGVGEHARVARPARRVAADVDDARHAAGGELRRPARARRRAADRAPRRRSGRARRAGAGCGTGRGGRPRPAAARGPRRRGRRDARRARLRPPGPSRRAGQREGERAEAGEQVGHAAARRRAIRAPRATSAASPSAVAWRKAPAG